eukprot:jgi/Ulvmu1/9080/UM005_0175.1
MSEDDLLKGAPKRRRARARAHVYQRWNRLFHWNDLPDYLRDNEYIVTGYRANTGVLGGLKSLFRVHNESGNIWTHLLGFAFFFGLLLFIIRAPPTPLALTHQDAHQLWDGVAVRLRNASATLLQHLQRTHEPGTITAFPAFQPDISPGKQLHDVFSETIHSLEAHVHDLPTMLKDRIHTVGEALRNPQATFHSISGFSAHELSTGMQHLRDGFEHSLSAIQASVAGNLHSLQALQQTVTDTLSTTGGRSEDHLRLLQHVAAELQQWVQTVVRKSVVWPVVRWPLYMYMFGAMTCLLVSAVCHLLGSVNFKVHSFIWRLDYAGIVGMIVSSFVPSIYYIFLCSPAVRWTYLSGIAMLGFATLALSLLNRFQTIKWRATRATCFSLLGVVGVVPWAHVLIAHPYNEVVWTVMMLDMMMGAAYLSGALLYATRVPERFFPGRFDLFFHSHQIFHVCVVVGAYMHYLGVMELLRWRDASGGCALQVSSGLGRHGDDFYDVDGLLGFLQGRIESLWLPQCSASLLGVLDHDGYQFATDLLSSGRGR